MKRAIGTLALLGVLAAGCGNETAAPAYVGKVTDPGADAVVGLVSDGERVQLYLCGGLATYASLTHWFQGPIASDGTFSIESNGFVATGDVGALAGEVKTADGETLTWSVEPATDALSGLYSVTDGSCRTGAVVGDFDGDGVLDLQGTWCDGKQQNIFAQVTPIFPMVTTARGLGVTVQTDPPRELWVDRVRAP